MKGQSYGVKTGFPYLGFDPIGFSMKQRAEQERQDEIGAKNAVFEATANPLMKANAARTPEGLLYSVHGDPRGMDAVPVTQAERFNDQQHAVVNASDVYSKMWNYSRDRAAAVGGRAHVKDDRQSFGTATPIGGLRRARGGY
jgi:hypothetical protein